MDAAGLAVVIGASGGIGAAFADRLAIDGRHEAVLRLSRRSTPALDLTDEASIAACAAAIAADGRDLRLVFVATGLLHNEGVSPERSFDALDQASMAKSFATNAIGPALLLKHFLPLFPRRGRAVFAALSAKVGSIGDNRLGGWVSYRASKAALNQIIRTASIELRRRRPDAICVALHPGTVATALSQPFAKASLDVHTPARAAADLLAVIEGLDVSRSGGFFDWRGDPLPP